MKKTKNTQKINSWALIGIPDHEAVLNLGGRTGAAEGPKAFRRVFSRFSGQSGVLECFRDEGDVLTLGSDVFKNHSLASAKICDAQNKFELTVVVGGSHDHGFSHLRGVKEALGMGQKNYRLGCINIDAHLDVRSAQPKITSGSPFYLAVESGVILPSDFVEFGIQRHCNAPALWDYVKEKKISVFEYQNLRNGSALKEFQKQMKQLSSQCDAVVVSLDLDAAASCYAPGVSAPQAEGFSSSELIQMMQVAGAIKNVVSLGVFELNPTHDVEDQTARLAATCVYYFIESAFER